MRRASESARAGEEESRGGVQGAPGGAGVRADADADAERAGAFGLAGADGSVSCVLLRLVSGRTVYDDVRGGVSRERWWRNGHGW
jgi:hypothetical protein